ncbi:glycosyltransferase family 4 protein [Patescibacteria group bacterium]|nr:glycosyltransferase family 4 protein [Patescibacteria group bacterium]
MKILFTRFPLESTYGGAEVQVLSLMEGLMKRGHAVTFLGSCPTLLEECKKRNIPSVELHIGPPPVTKWSALSFFWRKKKMSRLLKEAVQQFHDLDAIIMLSLTEKLLLTPFLVNQKPETSNQKLNVFWLEHDRVGRWLAKNPWLPKLKALSNKVTTIVVSELSKKIYVNLGWSEEKIIAIPNGIDPNRFSKSRSPSPSPSPSPHIGCISRLTPDKGVDLLIEAVKELPNVQLTIVGTGRDEKAIKQKTSNQKLVTIIPRVEDLGNFYNSLDVLVLPSREHDPFGLVAAEAMMLGVPVVVTDACGIADYLENGKDAVIVKAGSADALKEGIEKCISSENIAKEGQKTAMEKFTVEKMIDKYEKLLI